MKKFSCLVSLSLVLGFLVFATGVKAEGKTADPKITIEKQYEYDEKGNISTISKIKKNDQSQIIELSFYDVNNKLKEDNYGIAIYRYKYDKNGNQIEQSSYDANNKLKEDDSGIAIYRYKYDEKGNKIEESSYYDVNNKLKEDDSGVAIYRYKYDKNGNTIEQSSYDANNKLNEDYFGIATYKFKYDKNGNQIEKNMYDANNKLKEDDSGVASYRYKYDKNGNTIEQSSYDANNKLNEDYFGIATYKFKYDKNGNQIETSIYDAKNKLKEDFLGIATYKFKYDKNRNQIERSFYGLNNKLKENDEGVAIYKYKYNNEGNKIGEERYDANNKLKDDCINCTNVDNVNNSDLSEKTSYEKPKIELFVMSHCPYAIQMEKGLIPVLQVLKNDVDFELKFVNYAMHDKKELDEQLRQYCIQKNEPKKIISYLECFLVAGESDSCIKDLDIDTEILSSCVINTDKKYKVTENYENKTEWIGRFPSFKIYDDDNIKYNILGSPALVINGKEVSSNRDSMSLLNTICSYFNNKPEACNFDFSQVPPTANFGSIDSSCSDTTTMPKTKSAPILIENVLSDLYDKNIISTNSVNLFRGDKEVNRAEAAKFLLLAKGINPNDDIKNNDQFNDVINGEWYVKYVIEANKQDIIKGYADGSFKPNQSIRRGEFLVMLARTFNLSENISHSYQDITPEMEWVNNYAGIAEKYNLFPYDKIDDHNLKPADFMTRNEVAVAIYQYLQSVAPKITIEKQYEYDEKGNIATIREIKRNDQSKIVEITFYDANNKLKEDIEGMAIYRAKYDKKGNRIEGSNYGLDNKLKEDIYGMAIYRAKYDKNGKKIEQSLYGANNKLKENINDVAIYKYKYNGNGHLIESRNYGVNNKLKEDNNGIAIYRAKYDKNGNSIEQSLYDVNNKLKEDNNGVAIYKHKYDEKGNIIEENLYDVNNKLKENNYGVAIYKHKYDKNDHLIESSNYGVNNKLKEDNNGVAIYKFKYDKNGKKIEQSNYGLDSKLKEDNLGIASYRYKYDKNGILIKTTMYDKNNIEKTTSKIIEIK